MFRIEILLAWCDERAEIEFAIKVLFAAAHVQVQVGFLVSLFCDRVSASHPNLLDDVFSPIKKRRSR
jgi:hypothetical protein